MNDLLSVQLLSTGERCQTSWFEKPIAQRSAKRSETWIPAFCFTKWLRGQICIEDLRAVGSSSSCEPPPNNGQV